MRFFSAFALLAAAVSASPLAIREQVCENPGRLVSIVIDASGSNGATDPQHLRIAGGKDVINFLTPADKATASNKADRVAVVSFTTSATVLYPLGDPNAAAIAAVDRVADVGGTAVWQGVKAGIAQIASAQDVNNRGGLVVFTDGQDITKRDLLNQLNDAKAKGIRVSLGHLNPQKKNIFDIFGLLSGSNLDKDVSAAVLATGGVAATINNAEAQRNFVQMVLKNGITNNDGKCSGTEGPGGPIEPEIQTGGLCSNNAQAVFSYTAKGSEKLAFNVALVSKSNPVQLLATLENKVTGAKTQVTVNSGNPSLTLNGVATAGQGVTLTINPSGADDSQQCQYTVTLVVTKDSDPTTPPATSQVPPATSEVPPATSEVPPPTSEVPPPTSVTPPATSDVPPPTSVTPPATSEVPPTTCPAPTTVTVPGETITAPGATVTVPGETITAPGETITAPGVTITAPGVTVTSPGETVTVPGPTVTAPGETITAPGGTVTVTSTVTGAEPTATVCICKCDVPGAKPFPKFEL